MSKRRPAFDPRQTSLFDLQIDPVDQYTREGALEGIDRRVASAVSHMLAQAGSSRYALAGEVSMLLKDDVSKAMLDAYASEARDGHNISFGRFLALVVATHGYSTLAALVHEIGVAIIIGPEIATLELGHTKAQKAAVLEELKLLERRERELSEIAKPIMRRAK
jgi:hypothetical protein